MTPQNTGVLPYIKHINALLQQAVTTCKAAQNTDLPSQKQSLPIKESIPPGKNCDHQWRFKQTSKTPGRKKNGLILRLAVLIHKYAQLFESTPLLPHHGTFRHADSDERTKILSKLDSHKVQLSSL